MTFAFPPLAITRARAAVAVLLCGCGQPPLAHADECLAAADAFEARMAECGRVLPPDQDAKLRSSCESIWHQPIDVALCERALAGTSCATMRALDQRIPACHPLTWP